MGVIKGGKQLFFLHPFVVCFLIFFEGAMRIIYLQPVPAFYRLRLPSVYFSMCRTCSPARCHHGLETSFPLWHNVRLFFTHHLLHLGYPRTSGHDPIDFRMDSAQLGLEYFYHKAKNRILLYLCDLSTYVNIFHI